MANAGQSGQAYDKNYNLVTVLQQSLQNVWALSTYIDDARGENDEELASFFEEVRSHNEEAARQAKQMLAGRLEGETE
jgi:hypothetical protein